MVKASNIPLHKACLVCYTEGTTTGLALDGGPEWIVAHMMKLGLPRKEAEVTFKHLLRTMGGGYGSKVGSGLRQRRRMLVLVCQECADKCGATVDEMVHGKTLPCFTEPLL